MKARLVPIGNSRGIRLPKPLIEEAQLTEEVEIKLVQGSIVISSLRRPRAGWVEAARSIRERGDDVLLDPSAPTKFDDLEWEW